MPGLVPGIHVYSACTEEDVDGRDKPGHDVFTASPLAYTPVWVMNFVLK
jgi:hypothetical protein